MSKPPSRGRRAWSELPASFVAACAVDGVRETRKGAVGELLRRLDRLEKAARAHLAADLVSDEAIARADRKLRAALEALEARDA